MSERISDKGQGVFVSAWGHEDSVIPAAPAPVPMPERPAIAHANGNGTDVLRTVDPAPVVGLSRTLRERLATTPEANPVLVEQFRRLAATLHHTQTESGIRVIMMTSASPDDGKTLTAVNLALVLSESYRRRVLLIDADLRRPSLANVTDVVDAPGLTEALKSPNEQKLAILEVTPTLMLLPAGRPDPDPMGALTSARMRHILEEAASRFDWVILDAPPMGPMADANLLSQMVDGAVFVVRAGKTQHSAVRKAIDSLGRDRILGVVLNGLDEMPSEPGEEYYAPARNRK